MPELTPEKALADAEALAEGFGDAGILVPCNMANFTAAMMLIMTDIAESGCQCRGCNDICATLTAFLGQ
jgi:hypothetical protein